jgi:hypothetical protein
LRLAIDVCVTNRTELELWRAGYRIPVRAQNKEPDDCWITRADIAGCDVAITADHGAAANANRRGMYTIIVPFGTGGREMAEMIFDGLEEIEEQRTRRPSALLAPLAAVGIALLAACAPRPQAVEPARSPTPFCFRATVRVGENEQAAMACWQTAGTCAKAQSKASAMGGLMGLREIGACWRST